MDNDIYKTYLPKYIIIFDYLMKSIKNGTIRAGDKLPTEAELMQRFSVNRATVRAAFSKLETACQIDRQKGKGTFLKAVSPCQMIRSLQNFSSFNDDIANGKIVEWQIVDAGIAEADFETAQKLNIAEGTMIFQFIRIGYSENIPFVFEQVKNTTSLIPFFQQIDLSKVYYPLFQQKCNFMPEKMDILMQAVSADSQISKLLKIKEGFACMEVNSVLYDENHIPIDCTKAIYRGDKYVFSGETLIK